MTASYAGRFEGKVALVTGASSGIGKGIARTLGRQGAAVAVHYYPDAQREAALAVVAGVEADGGRAFALEGDVGRTADVRRLFDETLARLGRLDILVNNAAMGMSARIADVTEEMLDRILAVNVKGPFFACQEAAKRMADGGRIINLSTSTTALMLPNYGAYDATKGALEQITRILSKELGPRGITVNAVSPGATDTELFRKGKSAELIDRFEKMSSFGRLGTVEDIADVVVFLASDEARWITGQNIRVNGGTV